MRIIARAVYPQVLRSAVWHQMTLPKEDSLVQHYSGKLRKEAAFVTLLLPLFVNSTHGMNSCPGTILHHDRIIDGQRKLSGQAPVKRVG